MKKLYSELAALINVAENAVIEAKRFALDYNLDFTFSFDYVAENVKSTEQLEQERWQSSNCTDNEDWQSSDCQY